MAPLLALRNLGLMTLGKQHLPRYMRPYFRDNDIILYPRQTPLPTSRDLKNAYHMKDIWPSEPATRDPMLYPKESLVWLFRLLRIIIGLVVCLIIFSRCGYLDYQHVGYLSPLWIIFSPLDVVTVFIIRMPLRHLEWFAGFLLVKWNHRG